MVGWRLVLNYMQTPPTHCYLELGGRVAYMEAHPNKVDELIRATSHMSQEL